MTWRWLAALLAAAPAAAQPPEPPAEHCVTYDDRYSAAPLYRVRPAAGSQSLFRRPMICTFGHGCRDAVVQDVRADDVLLASAPRDGFRCAYLGTPQGSLVAGFIADSMIEPVPETPDVDAAFLRGRWNGFGGAAHVTFTADGATLRITGEATWRGFTTINIGAIDAPVVIEPGRFTAHEPIADCTVTGTRRGPYLVLRDNSQCGGMNVRFSGIFTRQR